MFVVVVAATVFLVTVSKFVLSEQLDADGDQHEHKFCIVWFIIVEAHEFSPSLSQSTSLTLL